MRWLLFIQMKEAVSLRSKRAISLENRLFLMFPVYYLDLRENVLRKNVI